MPLGTVLEKIFLHSRFYSNYPILVHSATPAPHPWWDIFGTFWYFFLLTAPKYCVIMNKKSKFLKYSFGTFWFLLDPLLRCFLVRYFLVLFGAFWAPAGALSVLDSVLVTVRRGSAETLATARTGVEKPAHAQRCSVADTTAPRTPFSHCSSSPCFTPCRPPR